MTTSGNRTRELPACSAVPQPTETACPFNCNYWIKVVLDCAIIFYWRGSLSPPAKTVTKLCPTKSGNFPEQMNYCQVPKNDLPCTDNQKDEYVYPYTELLRQYWGEGQQFNLCENQYAAERISTDLQWRNRSTRDGLYIRRRLLDFELDCARIPFSARFLSISSPSFTTGMIWFELPVRFHSICSSGGGADAKFPDTLY